MKSSQTIIFIIQKDSFNNHSFKRPKHMLKLMGKEKSTLLRQKILIFTNDELEKSESDKGTRKKLIR